MARARAHIDNMGIPGARELLRLVAGYMEYLFVFLTQWGAIWNGKRDLYYLWGPGKEI